VFGQWRSRTVPQLPLKMFILMLLAEFVATINNVMTYRFFVFFLLLNSCASFSEKRIKSKYFKDLDIYTLKGVNEVKYADYPNIEIADSANHRILIYHIDSIVYFQRDYRREENKWILNLFQKDDTTNIFTTRIIYPNKLVEFSYTDTILNKIYDVGFLIKDTMKYFRPETSYNRRFTISDISSIESKTSYSVRFWFDTNGKNVRLFKEFGQIKNESNIPITFCYPFRNRSFFWWFEMQYSLSSIPCQ
jgi:hypothetical protein